MYFLWKIKFEWYVYSINIRSEFIYISSKYDSSLFSTLFDFATETPEPFNSNFKSI